MDVGTSYSLDIAQAEAALDRLGLQDLRLRQQITASTAAGNAGFVQAAAGARQYDLQLAQALATVSESSTATQQLVKDIRDQAAAQVELRRAAAASADERRKATQAAREAAKTERAAQKEVEAAQKSASAAAKQAAKDAQDGAKKTSTSFNDLKGTIAAAFTFAAAKAFFDKVVSAGQATEALLSRLSFANGGNAQAAARDLAFVRAEADRLGLDLASAGNSYGSFTAAAAAANFPLAEARRLFLATAGAASTLKLSADDTQGVLLALNQILSKGSVQAEELRGQIGERLPGAFAIAARSMGVTEKELNKLLETGKVTAQDFLPKFSRELEKTFGDDSGKAVDSLTANLNRAGNEAQAFFLRFQSGASGLLSFLSKSGGGINQFLDQFTQGGRERLAEGKAQAAIKPYREFVELLFQQVSTAAKRGGRDVSADIAQAVAVQRTELERQAAEAERAISLLQRPRQGGFLNQADPEALAFLKSKGYKDLLDNEGAAFRKEEAIQQQRRLTAEGQLAILKESAEAQAKAGKAELARLGLIAKQEQLIKDLKERQKNEATTENKQPGGADFLLGAGGLDEQLLIAQKELDRLLGKVEKTKQAVDKLTPALRALSQERARLTEAAAAAISKESDDAAVRAQLAYEGAIRAADKYEAELKRREGDVRKAGGRGANADGVIDGPEGKALKQLRLAALDAYYTELYKITAAREQRLFDLRADTDQKEIDAINRKYDALLAAQRLGQSAEADAFDESAGLLIDRARKLSQEGIAIAEARERELTALRQRQEQQRIDNTAAVGTARANAAGETFGTGTSISVIDAKRAEKEALLEIERKHAQDTLNNTLLLGNKEGELARAQATATLARVKNELEAIEQEKASHKAEDFAYKLIFGEEDSEANRAKLDAITDQFKQALLTVVQADIQAADARISASTQRINELQSSLAAEIQLNREGAASNIATIQAQIAEEKEARKAAIAEKKKAQQEEAIINGLQQASALATAAANLILGWSELPIVGQVLGALSIAAMLASFIATKSAASTAAQSPGFFKGGYTGGDSIREERGPVHGKEFVFNNEKTASLRDVLFEPIHKGRPQDIRWDAPQMQAMLPDMALPARMKQERAEAQRVQIEHSFAPLRQELAGVQSELAAIRRTNELMANKPEIVRLNDSKYIATDALGNEKIVNVE